MDKKKLQQIIIILPIALIAASFGYYKKLLAPLNEQRKILKNDLDNIKKEYEDASAKAQRLPKLELEIALLNQEILEMQRKLPPTKDVPDLIRLLSKRMDYHRIVWKKLTPGIQSTKEYYVEYSYTIPFTTTYHNLAKFLAEIGQMERIFATKFIGLRPCLLYTSPSPRD